MADYIRRQRGFVHFFRFLDRYRFDGLGRGEAEDAGVEEELGFEDALGVLGLAEAVLFACER